jgi:hypothetical protein
VKTTDGLRDLNNTYTWYNPDGKTNGGEAGVQNGGKCTDSGCDTQGFIREVNSGGLCGAKDWRLPTRRELLSIVDNGQSDPAIDVNYFPNSASAHFWSSTPYADQESSAWNVFFRYGEVYPSGKNQSYHIRLVRGRTMTFGLENPR